MAVQFQHLICHIGKFVRQSTAAHVVGCCYHPINFNAAVLLWEIWPRQCFHRDCCHRFGMQQLTPRANRATSIRRNWSGYIRCHRMQLGGKSLWKLHEVRQPRLADCTKDPQVLLNRIVGALTCIAFADVHHVPFGVHLKLICLWALDLQTDLMTRGVWRAYQNFC